MDISNLDPYSLLKFISWALLIPMIIIFCVLVWRVLQLAFTHGLAKSTLLPGKEKQIDGVLGSFKIAYTRDDLIHVIIDYGGYVKGYTLSKEMAKYWSDTIVSTLGSENTEKFLHLGASEYPRAVSDAKYLRLEIPNSPNTLAYVAIFTHDDGWDIAELLNFDF
ncbi:hypothetical protein KAZ57_03625 [Patescibacteria group bacterium]|nr:hypothetical protein [Patescibacteria group bacterium]